MPVESISTADNEPLKHDGPGEDGTLLVRLDAPGPITIDYSFALDDEAHETFGYDLIFSIEPGSYWYPDVVNPDGSRDRFHDFEVVLEYPASHAVLTTGGEGEQENDGKWVRATYRAEHVEGFALAIGEGFVVERHDEGHVPIVAFFNPDHADAFATVRDGTAEAAAWYAQTYGFFPVPGSPDRNQIITAQAIGAAIRRNTGRSHRRRSSARRLLGRTASSSVSVAMLSLYFLSWYCASPRATSTFGLLGQRRLAAVRIP